MDFAGTLNLHEDYWSFVGEALIAKNKQGEVRWKVARKPFALLSRIAVNLKRRNWRDEQSPVPLALDLVTRKAIRAYRDEIGESVTRQDVLDKMEYDAFKGDYQFGLYVDEDLRTIHDSLGIAGGQIYLLPLNFNWHRICRRLRLSRAETQMLTFLAVGSKGAHLKKLLRWPERKFGRVRKSLERKLNDPAFHQFARRVLYTGK
jgi:hypothetical protein